MRPPILIVGCGHSGTTLLAVLLDAHPDIHLVRTETGTFHTPRVSDIERKVATFNRQAKARGASRWVEKTPSHVRRIERILDTVAGAQVIAMTRDPRDVVSSLRARGMTTDEAITRWTRANRDVVRWRRHPRVRQLRYEDLVEDPTASLTALCAWLGVPFSPAMLHHHENRQVWQGMTPPAAEPADEQAAHAQRRTWQISQPIFDGRGRWRDDPTSSQWMGELWTRAHSMAPEVGYSWR
jgi:hypothetical protein